MTDRFKFRVWNKTAKKYLMCPYIRIDDADDKAYISCDNDEVLEQCTGLKDKKGKLIYEGDILGGVYGGFIKWCDECKSFSMFYAEHCFSCNGDILWAEIVEDGNLEVIGNIHENGDLLE